LQHLVLQLQSSIFTFFRFQEERRQRYERERLNNIESWMDVVDISQQAAATEADLALMEGVR